MQDRRLRIALLYDCLYPYTVGGAERRYRALTERLAARHQVTYLTRRQWARGVIPDAPHGVRIVTVSGGRDLYAASGRRQITPPLRFGWGVFWHLLRHRRAYDVVHACSFPFFSLLAARLACAAGGPPIVTDWLEVWGDDYWATYLGRVGGRIGAAVQHIAIRATDTAFVLSHLQAQRLCAAGFGGTPVIVGAYDGPITSIDAPAVRQPLIVYAGRHIAEKRVTAIPAAVALARRRIPQLRAVVFGDGPERRALLNEIERCGLSTVISAPGFVAWEIVDAALRQAMCLLLPSQREGYGLVVIEAAARGTPSIVVRDAANAATELIAEGYNGVVAPSADPAELAHAIAAVHASGPTLVMRTREWFHENASRVSLDASLGVIENIYARLAERHRSS